VKSAYTSGELFHFVGRPFPDDDEANYQTLLKVLRSGCVSHPPHRPDWGIVSHHIDFTKRLIDEELKADKLPRANNRSVQNSEQPSNAA